jgi:hypothetical protein
MEDPKILNNPHEKSKDEAIVVSQIHYHLNNNTPSGIKIKEAFVRDLDLSKEDSLLNTKVSGATRSIHHDFQIIMSNNSENIKNVEFKGSKYFKPIDFTKSPWINGVQFYNGTGNKFSIGRDYAIKFYDECLDTIIKDLNIITPKPSYDEWSKDAFRQGKPITPFVCELREKGYCSEYLSVIRKKFNKRFIATTFQLIKLMFEVEELANEVLKCKDYWLQIHGDINDSDNFNVRWTNKIEMPEIISVEQLKSKNKCDINFKFVCTDDSEFYAKMRWGYGQCITNIRIDIK